MTVMHCLSNTNCHIQKALYVITVTTKMEACILAVDLDYHHRCKKHKVPNKKHEKTFFYEFKKNYTLILIVYGVS